jgi:uncharacterized lipoprotein YmbA
MKSTMPWLNSALVLVLTSALAACAGAGLERHEYLLRPETATAPADADGVARLTLVEVAPYLDQDGIVLLGPDSEVHVGKQHLWAEGLNESVQRYLQVAIGTASGRVVEVAPVTTGRPAPEIEVRIHQLHGSVDGRARLVAEWSVTQADGSATLHEFESVLRISADGYPALVAAHGELLDELAEAIAGALE